MVKIGTKVKELAEAKGMNISQVAKAAELPYNTVYAIVKRESNRIEPEIVEKLADVLGVSATELQGLNDKHSIDVEINTNTIIGGIQETQSFIALAERIGYSFSYEPPGFKNCWEVKKNGETIDAMGEDAFYRLVKRMTAVSEAIIEATAKSLIEDELINQGL